MDNDVYCCFPVLHVLSIRFYLPSRPLSLYSLSSHLIFCHGLIVQTYFVLFHYFNLPEFLYYSLCFLRHGPLSSTFIASPTLSGINIHLESHFIHSYMQFIIAVSPLRSHITLETVTYPDTRQVYKLFEHCDGKGHVVVVINP